MNESESKVLSVSIRAWLAVILVSTVCAMALLGIEITGFFAGLVGSAIGCYFGQKEKRQ